VDPLPHDSGSVARSAQDVAYRGPSIRGSLVLTGSGIVVAALLGAFANALAAALAISATLGVAGMWRAVAPKATHAAGIVVRSRLFDVVLYLGLAVAIAVLALTTPSVA
jgi:hypothetical protein